MRDPFTDIQASLFAFCKAFAAEMMAADVANLEVFKFDAHADINQYPETDLIGPAALSIDIDDGMVEAMTVLGISTMDDQNTFRLDALIGQLLRRVKTGTVIALKDSETGQPYGTLKVQGQIRVLPVELTKIRPFRGIAIQVGSDRTLIS